MTRRRVVNDMVDDMDMKRKKSLALMTGRADSEMEAPFQGTSMQPQRSRSFKVLLNINTPRSSELPHVFVKCLL